MCFQRTAPDLNLTLSWLLQGRRPQLCWPSHVAPETGVTEETHGKIKTQTDITAQQGSLFLKLYDDRLCLLITEHLDLCFP